MEQVWLDAKTVMDALSVDVEGLVSLICEQGLPAFRLGREIRFPAREFEQWASRYAGSNRIGAEDPTATLTGLVETGRRTADQRAASPGDPAALTDLLKDHDFDATPGLVDLDVLDRIVEQYQATAIPSTAPAPAAKKQAKTQTPAESQPYSIVDEEKETGPEPVELFDEFSIRYRVFETEIRIRPGAAGNPGVFDRVQMVLEDMDIRITDFAGVRDMLLRHPGRWVRLTESPNPFLERVNVQISRDGMRAYMVAMSDDVSGDISTLNIDTALEAAGVTHGVDRGLIDRAVSDRLFGNLIPIACGQTPVNGEDARIEYMFDMEMALTPQTLESGNVDFKNINNMSNVREGDLVARLHPPTQGVHGKDVRGRSVDAEPGRSKRLRAGRNTVLSEDGFELHAETDGHVLINDGAVHVDKLFVVNSDLDYSVGNVSFTGMVVVNGFVRDGFEIATDGEVCINGGVEGARITTTEGDITIRLGVQGQGRAVLSAGGNVKAKFIHQAAINAGGDVIVQEAIMHSTITAGSGVMAEGAGGCIIGGRVHAQDTIITQKLGSEAHPRTHLILEKRDPDTGTPVRTILARQKARVERELGRCTSELARLRKKYDDKKPDPEIIRGIKTHTHKARGLNDILERVKGDIRRFNHQYGPAGKRVIRAGNTAYSQVFIEIEGVKLKISDDLKAVTFSVDGDKIIGL